MEVTLAIYVLNGSDPYARVAVAFDNTCIKGVAYSESDMSIGSKAVKEYVFVGFKTVNLGNVI